MKRSALACVATALTLSVATGFAVNACSSSDLVETPGEKTEWSVLQGIEFQERDNPLKEPTFRMVGTSEVLGLRDMTGKNTWLLLRVQSPPYYKQMPAVNYEVPKTLVDQLVKEHRASYTVVQVLRSHVRAQ
jgi:hypothetical protein